MARLMAHHLGAAVATAAATARCEARMALRGRALWLAAVPVTLLGLLVSVTPLTGGMPARLTAGEAASSLVLLLPIGVGVAFADRFRRSRGTGIAELLAATPLSTGGWLLGTFAGALAVALVPLAVLTTVLAVLVAVRTGDPAGLVWTPLAVAAVPLPGCLWAAALSATLGLLLPVPASRVLVVPLWLWATVWNFTLLWVPTPTGTLLAPSGEYPAAAWFGVHPPWAGAGQVAGLSPGPGGTPAALLWLGCTLAAVAVLLLCSRLILVWKR
ncbi:hypothetical protein [Marinitenerispora sediminis]|uniref:Uncharacterized protein n=1 Tax=Marinitenerispora sediminis TaxID=1931232 RepID=A0A368T9N0_9ACTN|nr:hypothetical protein [Marinitenerispora sediminis]RCV52804.1 hypothetical protein DEF28_12105 [Marinitenerispora sediminis]RCV59909.1 hypothetical protein DEF23_06085 [Marinitenerispora sediminis]RCV61325.1 hypothetical protein DEF24_04620 [Marinitenerispora sediminis]